MPDHTDESNASEDTVEVNGQEYLRVPVTAKLKLADPDQAPEPIADRNRAIANSLHFKDAKNPDLTWVSFILDSEGPNNNWDYMPRPALASGYDSVRWKPFDMDHIVAEDASMVFMPDRNNPPVRNTIFGVMTSASLGDHEGNLLDKQAIADLEMTDKWDRPREDRVTVVAWAALYSFLFPQTVSQLVQAIDQGQMHVSMERWIGKWDYLVANKGEYQGIPRKEAEQQGYAAAWSARTCVNDAPVYRRSLNYVYGGAASTGNPANKMATFIEPSHLKAAAHVQQNDAFLKNLLDMHCQVHREWELSSGSQRDLLIAKHQVVTQAISDYLEQKS